MDRHPLPRWALLGVLLAACTRPNPVVPPSPPAAASFDLERVVAEAAARFRVDGDGHFRAYAGGVSAELSRRGELEVEARSVDGARAELRLSTRSIARGGWTPKLPKSAEPEGDGAVVRRGPGASERFRGEPGGIEQSWDLPQRPPGSGDLVVRIAVQTSLRGAAGPQGIAFFSRSTPALRYGAATWIDARGERTAVPATLRGREILLRVPAAIVDDSAYPAILDPIVSAEFPVDAPTLGPAGVNQYRPAAAFDGTNFLVVWHDGRSGEMDIYGTRVTPAGQVLDPYGIPISTAPGNQWQPGIAWDGTQYFVSWSDERTSSVSPDIYAARVTPAGAVLDPNGILVSGAAGSQSRPTVSWDGTSFVVAWSDSRVSTNDVYAARVTPTGTVLDPTGIPVCSAADSQYPVRAASGGGVTMLVWGDRRSGTDYDVYGARIDGSGTVLDPGGFLVSNAGKDQADPEIAFNGTSFLAAWEDYRKGSTSEIYAARISPAGAVLDATGIGITSAGGYQLDVSVASDGTDFLVDWTDNRGGVDYDVYAARVTGAGAVVDANGIAVCTAAGAQDVPRVAYGGGQYLALWADARSGSYYDIYGSRISTAGAVLDPSGLLLSTAGNEEHTPAIAYDGANYLIAWSDMRGASSDIYAVRATPSGTVLDAPAIAVSTAAGAQSEPAVAFDGANYLVAWSDYRSGSTFDVYASRVSPSGAVLDAAGIAVSTATSDQRAPRVASNGSSFLVAWKDNRNDSGNTIKGDVYGARVSPAGAVLDAAGIAISRGTEVEQAPSLAAAGGSYFVAWEDYRNFNVGTTRCDVYGARVDSNGVVLDASGIAITTELNDDVEPAVATDGTDFLVTWMGDYSVNSSPTYPHVYGARVTAAGAVLDATRIPISTTYVSRSPVVAWDGTAYLVAWQDERPGAANPDVYGAKVSSAGATSSAFPISNSPYPERWPAAASGGGGSAMVAYERFEPAIPANATRVFGRVLSPGSGAQGDPCASGSDCANGQCVDGVCCNAACGGGVTTDCQACSVAAGAASDGLCGPVNSGRVCRTASGLCDAAETCDGVALTCPADGVAGPGTLCRSALSSCDVPETCDGTTKFCPSNLTADAGTMCRPSTGPCDPAERCDGVSTACPADGIADAGTPCRAAVGSCDVAETCDGLSAACPANAVVDAGTECRASTGPCDLAESCDGSGGACPADVHVDAGTVCHASTGGCDPAEVCDGANGACPPDALALSGTACRAAAGACDVAEACDGLSAACPVDAVLDAGTECRASTGDCDLAESCDGASAACPPDALAPQSTVCRPSAGPCDLSESCTGVDPECPQDLRIPAGGQGDPSCGQYACDGVGTECSKQCDPTTGTCRPIEYLVVCGCGAAGDAEAGLVAVALALLGRAVHRAPRRARR